MKARLLSLTGKYYGTEIEITDEGRKFVINLWKPNSLETYIPSKRELEGVCTEEEWINNKEINIDGETIKARDAVEIDEHTELKKTYEFALKLISKINKN